MVVLVIKLGIVERIGLVKENDFGGFRPPNPSRDF